MGGKKIKQKGAGERKEKRPEDVEGVRKGTKKRKKGGRMGRNIHHRRPKGNCKGGGKDPGQTQIGFLKKGIGILGGGTTLVQIWVTGKINQKSYRTVTEIQREEPHRERS